VKRCYVSTFSATESILREFSLSKGNGRGGVGEGVIPLVFSEFAFNEESRLTEGVMEFTSDKVHTSRVQSAFADLMGLPSAYVNIGTFQKNDGDRSAAAAINMVRKMAKSPGFKLVVGNGGGKCPAKLNDVAEKLREKTEQSERDAYNRDFNEKLAAAMKQSALETGEKLDKSVGGVAAVDGKVDLLVGTAEAISVGLNDTLAKETQKREHAEHLMHQANGRTGLEPREANRDLRKENSRLTNHNTFVRSLVNQHIDSLKTAITEFKDEAGLRFDTMEEEFEGIRDHNTDMSTRLDALPGQIETAKNAMNGRFDVATGNYNGRLNTFKTEINGRFDTMTAQFDELRTMIVDIWEENKRQRQH
jgi:hypothetical protein